MMRNRTVVATFIAAIGLTVLAATVLPTVSAQGPSRAALVIQAAPAGGPGNSATATSTTLCIDFTERSISGLELLARSGLSVVTWGGAVCQIEQTGCQYPSEPCFCQCMRPPCSYWSYWYWKDDRWMYSAIGSADHTVVDGSVEAWMWGNADTPPDVVAFSDVCPSDASLVAPPVTTDGSVAPPPVAQYAAFIVMALVMLGGVWLTRRGRLGSR